MDWIIPVVAPFMDVLAEALVLLILALVGWAAKRFFGIKIERELNEQLHQMLRRGVNKGLAEAQEWSADHLSKVELEGRVARIAETYVQKYGPDTLTRLGVTPEALADLIRAHLPVATRTMLPDGTTMVVDPTLPWLRSPAPPGEVPSQ
jgi:hypothetical protein